MYSSSAPFVRLVLKGRLAREEVLVRCNPD